MTHPTGTVTFLFTDIEQSTALWEAQPAWMAAAFARQEALIRAAVAAHGGYAYKMIGDAFQVAFATAPAALAAALAAQQALAAADWGAPGPLRVRMALHTGVTDERTDDYVGPALNRVARLLALAAGGQILLSQATFELVRDSLPPDVRLVDRGEHRLKDLIRPEHLYQVAAPGLPASDAPLPSLDAFPHNLPLQVTSFVGRQQAMADVKQRLLADRLVTLTGPGGTGKTRLALQVGAELLELFPDGVWLVELVALADPSRVVGAVAQVLGVRESSGRPLLSLLTGFLRGKDLLLVLDNCEHLVDACAQLAAHLLAACPTLFILASSREALGIPGEVAYRVPSLTTPDARRPPPFETLTQYEAVRLFIERAETVLPGFAVTRANAPAIAQICHRLEGIPLAIELAAVRVKLLRPEQIAARLDDRFRLLTGGARTALPRHQTLRALIDWSYDLLTPPERTLLGRLSVFAGGWTLDAAEAVTADERETPEVAGQPAAEYRLPTADILDVLQQLVNKSLVIPEQEMGAENRYRLLETIRQYARDKLLDAGGGEAVRGRHLAYFEQLAEVAAPHLRGPEQVAWLDRLEQEVDNLRAALERALDTDVPAGLRLAGALLWFWHMRPHKQEGIEWLERALYADRQTEGERSTARQLARGQALNAAATLSMMHRSPESARALAEESLTLHGKLGSAGRHGVAEAQWVMAQVVAQHEAYAEAIQLSEASQALYRELGDRFGYAQCLDNLAGYAITLGNYTHARQLWEENLALRRALGDQDGVAWSLSSLGRVAFFEGDFETARRLNAESVEVFGQLNNQWGVSMALSSVGDAELAQGRYDEAARDYEQALAYGRDMGDPNTVAGRRYDLARVDWAQGRYAKAAEAYELNLAYCRELNIEGAVAGILIDLAGTDWAQGQLDRAASHYEEALCISRAIGARHLTAGTLTGLARVALAHGDTSAGRTCLAQAFEKLIPHANPWWGLEATVRTSALLAVTEQDMARAARLLGALEGPYRNVRYLLSPLEREEHARCLAEARAALGEAEFAAQYAAGQADGLARVAAEALARTAHVAQPGG